MEAPHWGNANLYEGRISLKEFIFRYVTELEGTVKPRGFDTSCRGWTGSATTALPAESAMWANSQSVWWRSTASTFIERVGLKLVTVN